MTKEQFLSGAQFYIGAKKYKGDSTYNYDGGHISRQTRSSIDDRLILNDYECNITEVGKTGFIGFTYVMKKKVVVKYKFKDLNMFEDKCPEYD
jgi:hypothetical protein